METVENIVALQGANEIDSRLEEQLIDGLFDSSHLLFNFSDIMSTCSIPALGFVSFKSPLRYPICIPRADTGRCRNA